MSFKKIIFDHQTIAVEQYSKIMIFLLVSCFFENETFCNSIDLRSDLKSSAVSIGLKVGVNGHSS